MTDLTYEDAKELKDAGWPQPEFNGGECWAYAQEHGDFGMEAVAYSPSLSELIAACPRGWLYEQVEEPYPFLLGVQGIGWHANYTLIGSPTGEGSTPEQAVKNLWIALKSCYS